MTDKMDHFETILDDFTIEELAEATGTAMATLYGDNEPRRFTMLFNFLQENYPEALEEFTLRFVERDAEQEDTE